MMQSLRFRLAFRSLLLTFLIIDMGSLKSNPAHSNAPFSAPPVMDSNLESAISATPSEQIGSPSFSFGLRKRIEALRKSFGGNGNNDSGGEGQSGNWIPNGVYLFEDRFSNEQELTLIIEIEGTRWRTAVFSKENEIALKFAKGNFGARNYLKGFHPKKLKVEDDWSQELSPIDTFDLFVDSFKPEQNLIQKSSTLFEDEGIGIVNKYAKAVSGCLGGTLRYERSSMGFWQKVIQKANSANPNSFIAKLTASRPKIFFSASLRSKAECPELPWTSEMVQAHYDRHMTIFIEDHYDIHDGIENFMNSLSKSEEIRKIEGIDSLIALAKQNVDEESTSFVIARNRLILKWLEILVDGVSEAKTFDPELIFKKIRHFREKSKLANQAPKFEIYAQLPLELTFQSFDDLVRSRSMRYGVIPVVSETVAPGTYAPKDYSLSKAGIAFDFLTPDSENKQYLKIGFRQLNNEWLQGPFAEPSDYIVSQEFPGSYVKNGRLFIPTEEGDCPVGRFVTINKALRLDLTSPWAQLADDSACFGLVNSPFLRQLVDYLDGKIYLQR